MKPTDSSPVPVPETSRRALLRRYTNVMAVIDMLTHRHIVLTNTAHWADRNDHLVIDEYRARVGAAKAFATCLTEADETFHHWEIFAGGQTGVCVVFDKATFVAGVPAELLSGSVTYRTFSQMREQTRIEIGAIPFLKRAGFSDEREFRIVGTANDANTPCLPMTIQLDAIASIVFSPFVPEPLVKATKTLIKTITGCDGLTIGQSKLTTNKTWLNYVRRLQAI